MPIVYCERKLRIVTRSSPLALWQANKIKSVLCNKHPNLDVTIIEMICQGDKILHLPLSKIGGKSLFVKELEEYLLQDKADIAVHSMKDVESNLPFGLSIGAVFKRDSPNDVLLSHDYTAITDIPIAAIIGTSSLRRQSQMLALREDLNIVSIRGNIHTRLNQIGNPCDGIILAAAAIERLAIDKFSCITLPLSSNIPAAGQGALGIEYKTKNSWLHNYLVTLNDYETYCCVMAEREMNKVLGADCHSPVGGYASINSGYLFLTAYVGSIDGKKILTVSSNRAISDYKQLGHDVGIKLLDQGALELIKFKPS